MNERGRHRAPGRHARPKNRHAPLVAFSIVGALVFGISFGDRAYSFESKPVAIAVDPVALTVDEATFIDVKELAPDSKTVTTEIEIPYAVSETPDPSIAKGTVIVKQPGSSGTAVVTYDVKILNGVEVSRTEVSRSVNREPIPEVVIAGSGDPKAITAAVKQAESSIDTIAESKKYAELYIKTTYAWGEDQFACLDRLWERESNWRHTAKNKSSSAYGIPQALPGIRMAEIADDWQTNPATQIKWGAQYISKRYGTPCAALDKSLTRGWY